MDNQGTVLLIEDNAALNDANSRALRLRGFTVLTALTLTKARNILYEHEPDVILLDVMLPDGDGFSFCEEIRGKTAAHILFLTAKTEQEDMVRGLTGGGDDYITKPFHPEELMARVGAAMRRRKIGVPADVLVKGALTLDIVAQTAHVNGIDLRLTQKEFALLLLLAQNEGKVMSTDLIYEKVWKAPLTGDKNAVQTAVSRLRRKMAGTGYDICSYRGKGYAFEVI
jgi:DNA-binding response OmpR family regulator